MDIKTKQALQLTLKDVQLHKQTLYFCNTFLIWTASKLNAYEIEVVKVLIQNIQKKKSSYSCKVILLILLM